MGAALLSYDGNGNLTGDGTSTFGYDAESRLISVTTPANTASYAYDPQGRRKAKVVNGTTTSYLLDGDQEIAEHDGAGALLRRFVFGPGLDEPVAQITASGRVFYYRQDALGSIVAHEEHRSGFVQRFAYGPFGESATLAGHAFRYAGRRADAESGLYYDRARYYSPQLGRFLQPDPIGYTGGINLYAYVENDPLNFTDPYGECPTCLAGGLLNVAIGYGISRLTGGSYSWGNAALDFGIGAVTGGVAAITAARRGAQILEGVYAAGARSGRTYVGQSRNIPRRLMEHVADGKITQRAANSTNKFEV